MSETEPHENILIIEGNKELTELFSNPTNQSIQLRKILLKILKGNAEWGKYFDEEGISKNPNNIGLRLTTNVTYPYSGSLPLGNDDRVPPTSTQVGTVVNNLRTYGSEKANPRRLWISYINKDDPISRLGEPLNILGEGNLGSVTEYAFPKGYEAHQNYIKPNVIIISLYDMTKLQSVTERYDAYIPKEKSTFSEAHVQSFMIEIPD